MKNVEEGTTKQKLTEIKSYITDGGYLKIDKRLITLLDATKATFIANLIDNYKNQILHKKIKDEWFYVPYKIQSEQTGISNFKVLKKCKKAFIELGCLETKKRGIPAKEYYKLDISKLREFVGNKG